MPKSPDPLSSLNHHFNTSSCSIYNPSIICFPLHKIRWLQFLTQILHTEVLHIRALFPLACALSPQLLLKYRHLTWVTWDLHKTVLSCNKTWGPPCSRSGLLQSQMQLVLNRRSQHHQVPMDKQQPPGFFTPMDKKVVYNTHHTYQ